MMIVVAVRSPKLCSRLLTSWVVLECTRTNLVTEYIREIYCLHAGCIHKISLVISLFAIRNNNDFHRMSSWMLYKENSTKYCVSKIVDVILCKWIGQYNCQSMLYLHIDYLASSFMARKNCIFLNHSLHIMQNIPLNFICDHCKSTI